MRIILTILALFAFNVNADGHASDESKDNDTCCFQRMR